MRIPCKIVTYYTSDCVVRYTQLCAVRYTRRLVFYYASLRTVRYTQLCVVRHTSLIAVGITRSYQAENFIRNFSLFFAYPRIKSHCSIRPFSMMTWSFIHNKR